MGDRVEVNFELLDSLAKKLASEGEVIATLFSQTRTKATALHNSGWIGRGADAFFKEMETRLLPGLDRLSKGLAEADQAIRKIIQVFQQAEDEAAGHFKGAGQGDDVRESGAGGRGFVPSGGGGGGVGNKAAQTNLEWMNKVESGIPASFQGKITESTIPMAGKFGGAGNPLPIGAKLVEPTPGSPILGVADKLGGQIGLTGPVVHVSPQVQGPVVPGAELPGSMSGNLPGQIVHGGVDQAIPIRGVDPPTRMGGSDMSNPVVHTPPVKLGYASAPAPVIPDIPTGPDSPAVGTGGSGPAVPLHQSTAGVGPPQHGAPSPIGGMMGQIVHSGPTGSETWSAPVEPPDPQPAKEG